MDDFEYYANLNGVIWYRCCKCQYKTRGKPEKCPVCCEKEEKQEMNNETAKSLDGLLDRYKALFEKYGGNDDSGM